MKNPINVCAGLAAILVFFSCNNGSTDSVKNAKESNAEKIDSQKTTELRSGDSTALPMAKADADFLVNAASGGMMEVRLGELAKENSRNQRVKNFGALMVRDHGEGGEKLKKLAATKNVTLPANISNDQQKEKDDLQKKTGDEFDRAYVNMMVDDHNKDIKDFEKAAKDATDPDVKTFAAHHLPMLYMHLDSAKNLQKLMKPKRTMPETVPPQPK